MTRALVMGMLGLAAAAESATAKPDHHALYRHATTAHAKLNASAVLQKKTSQWISVIEAYRRVVHHYPQSGYCDNALLAIGDLYGGMSSRFKTPQFRTRAIEAYRALVAEYPSSPKSEEALYKVFQLAAASKDGKQIAQATEAYLEAFPDGKNARAVKAVIKNKAAPSPPPPGLGKVFGDTLRFWSGPTSTRVVLEMDKQVRILHQERLSNPDRVFIDLEDTRLHPKQSLQVFPVDDGLLQDVNIGQNRPGVVRVVLKFKTARDHKAFFLPDPVRLVIDVNSTPPEKPVPTTVAEAFPTPEPGEFDVATPTPTPSPYTGTVEARPVSTPTPVPAPRADVRSAAHSSPAPTPDHGPTLYRQLGLGVRTIVIDAGHGGHDPGCIGQGGLQEKELVLSVALRLEKLIRSEMKGVDVIMTRSRDEFVPLVERTAVANQKGADLFLSIHANSSRNRTASGLETYILSFTHNKEEQELAQRENEMSQETFNNFQGLLQAIALTGKRDESREFASSVQQSMVSNLRPHNPLVKDRGVRKAPLLVLVGSNMPAVLAEIAFVSNPQEEKLLRTSEYRDRIARSLLAGVRQYMETLNRAPVQQLTAKSGRSTVKSGGRVLPPLPVEPASRRSRSRR